MLWLEAVRLDQRHSFGFQRAQFRYGFVERLVGRIPVLRIELPEILLNRDQLLVDRNAGTGILLHQRLPPSGIFSITVARPFRYR